MKSRMALAFMMAFLSSNSYSYDFSYNFVQFSLGSSETDVENVDIDGDSFGLSGSFEVSENAYFVVGYTSSDFDFDIDQEIIGAGVGFHTDSGEKTDLIGEIVVVNAEIEQPQLGSDDDSGLGLMFGVRHSLNNNIEVNANISYVDLFDDDSTGFGLGGRFYANESFSLGLGYSTSDDTDGFSISFRFSI